MVARKLSTKRFIISTIIAFLAFSLGISLDMVYNNMKVQRNEEIMQEQELEFNSVQLQYLYLSEMLNSKDACPTMRLALKNSVDKLGESLNEFEKMFENNRFNDKEREEIERKYLLDNIRYWIFSKQIKESCGHDVVNVLYFYSLEECNICSNQGVILSYFKKKYKDSLLVFPINTDIDEYMIDLIESRYNITEYPSLVVDNVTHPGLIYQEELGDILCQKFQNKSKCEKGYIEKAKNDSD